MLHAGCSVIRPMRCDKMSLREIGRDCEPGPRSMIVSHWEGHDATLAYRRCGHGDTYLVFLHGVLRRGDTFLPLLMPLATHFTTIAVDLRGHGGSSHPACGYRVCDYLSDVVDWLKADVRHPVVLYGHSLGAMVAAGAAAQLPDQVQAVILEDPPFQTMGRRIRETRWHGYFGALAPLAGSRQPLPQLVEQLAAVKFRDPASGEDFCLGRMRGPVALRYMADCLRGVAPQAIEAILDGGWLASYDERQVLARLTRPALVLQADPAAGGMLTDGDAEFAHSVAADLSLIKLAGAQHLMHSTRTQEVLNLVTTFLSTLGPP